jgi:hypothetical protein
MSKPTRKRIVIEILPDNLEHCRVYDHIESIDDRKHILDIYGIHYQPSYLAESKADSLEILIAATHSANQLFSRIQQLVKLLVTAGIQPPPSMLAMAGLNGLQATETTIATLTAQALMPSVSPAASIEEDDDDDWGEIPQLTEAQIAVIKASEKDLGVNYSEY